MKKIALVALALPAFIFAQVTYTKADRIKDMQSMESALATIQKGFLYNKVDMVDEGVSNLKTSVKHVEPEITGDESLLNKKETYSYKFSQRKANKIIILADELLESYKEKDKYNAMSKYNKILKSCISCHSHIREW